MENKKLASGMQNAREIAAHNKPQAVESDSGKLCVLVAWMISNGISLRLFPMVCSLTYSSDLNHTEMQLTCTSHSRLRSAVSCAVQDLGSANVRVQVECVAVCDQAHACTQRVLPSAPVALCEREPFLLTGDRSIFRQDV
jgi:hypothetical protein